MTRLRERAELLELASEAIMVRDKQGAIRFWNAGAEALYGWKREEVIGQDLKELLGTRPADAQARSRRLWRRKDGGKAI